MVNATQLSLPGFLDTATTCPRCGHRFVPERAAAESISPLSPVAAHVLAHIREYCRSGSILRSREIGDAIGYSHVQAWRGLVELAERGYITRLRRGEQRHNYILPRPAKQS